MLEGAILKGRYRLDRPIDGGGGCAVFQATDLQIARTVAVRVIAFAPGASREDAAVRDRFRNHAAMAARLRHPNVVAVNEAGTDEALGLDFVVMELLQGEDVQRRVRRKHQLSWLTVSRILQEAASGLGAGHRLGLVHGGVSPSHLFLERDADGKPVRTRVLGLGTLPFPDRVSTAAGRPGHPSGSLPYAAPEQRRGESQPSAAADAWGLAVSAFEMLTGTLPFTEEQNGALARGVRVRPADLSRLNPTVPPAVDALIARFLSPHPGERPPDGEAISRELDAILGNGHPAAPPALIVPGPEARIVPVPPDEARKEPLPTPPLQPASAPKRRRGVGALSLAGGTVAVVALLSSGVFDGLFSERARAYFATVVPYGPSRVASSEEIDHIRFLYRRIEDGGPGTRERRMELDRFPRFEWPSSDSAHATVYENEGELQKIRIRVYHNGARTAWLFYYDSGSLAFVHQVAPSGGGRDAEQRFYFRDRTLIRWRDTRNDIVPLDRGHDEFALQLLRISDRLLETARRTSR